MTNNDIEFYSEMHTSEENPVLKKIHRDTCTQMPYPRMLSGHLQGRLLSFISKCVRPSVILEVGAFTGYSAICLAEGLAPEGVLYTIEINPELEDTLINNFLKAGMDHKIKLLTGNALDLIPEINVAVDIAFLDADKENYPAYYKLIIEKLRPGGILLADNVLWSGKVLTDTPASDMESNGIKRFNDMVMNDNLVENLLLPFRDGLMMVRKL